LAVLNKAALAMFILSRNVPAIIGGLNFVRPVCKQFLIKGAQNAYHASIP